MTAFPKYPAYKDSGVEWLGEVPDHWEIMPFLAAFDMSGEKNGKNIVGNMLSISGYRGVEEKRYESDSQKRSEEQLADYRVVRRGQLAVNTMWLNYAGLGVSELEGHMSPAYRAYNIRPKLQGRFAHHLLRSFSYVQGYTGLMQGIRPNSLQIKSEDFKRIPVLVPPRAEQDRIVAFLDEKTAQIDALIAKKQRQIELLDEQKAILINRAVTRGLHPNPDLQDSGIPWIGPIPKGWEVKSAKHVCERIIDCKNRTAEVVTQGDYYVLRTSNVKKGELVRDEITRTNLKNFTIWTERGAPETGDVLFTREAPAGEACVFDGSLPACLGQRMMYFRPDVSLLLPQFLVHAIYFGPSATYIQLKTNGSTVGHLRLPDVYALPVLLPPVDEQRRILDTLAATDESQKKLIQTTQSQIQTLQTLRTSLIAHAVTGKIKVA